MTAYWLRLERKMEMARAQLPTEKTFRSNRGTQVLIILCVLIAGFSASMVNADSGRVGLLKNDDASFDGYTLFGFMGDDTTYLIDNNGYIVHSWGSDFPQPTSSYLLEEWGLLRTAAFGSLAKNGFQVLERTGHPIWEFEYPGSHHDIEPLPNGNVLMIVDEILSESEALTLGRNPALLGGKIWDRLVKWLPEHSGQGGQCLWSPCIVEVEKTGLNSGTIVWEWHLKDHLIQDYDKVKSNYGVVSEHPELVNINFAADASPNWVHANYIDYNPDLDHIMITSRNFSEVWIIDHSTTKEETAGHTGGKSGRGGIFFIDGATLKPMALVPTLIRNCFNRIMGIGLLQKYLVPVIS